VNYYRILSAEPNPDPIGAELHMRSPIRTFSVAYMISGDFDDDDDVDQEDFGTFQVCLSGPGFPHAAGCERADLDGDNDVDQNDFGLFQNCLSGAGVPGDPNCAD
jgi:hypothetical protein